MIGFCKVCRGVIFISCTPSMLDDSVDIIYSHAVRPDDGHPAQPMDEPDRVLMCAKCGNPQVRDRNGWHCESPQCSRVDKA